MLNQFAGQAWIKQDATSWLYARSLSLSEAIYPFANFLHEGTGHIPALNNGPPVPPGGGHGGAYGVMGAALQDGVNDFTWEWINNPNNYGVAAPLEGTPINLTWGDQGQSMWREALYAAAWLEDGICCNVDHEPEFEGLTYQVWGPEWELDTIYLHAAHVLKNETQQLLPGGSGNAYVNNLVGVMQTRGGWWAELTVGKCAALGDDSRDEQKFCQDVLTENYWANLDWLPWVDGTVPGAIEHSITPPGGVSTNDTFISVYGTVAAYPNWVMLHDPFAKSLLDREVKTFQAACGHSIADYPSYPRLITARPISRRQPSPTEASRYPGEEHGRVPKTWEGPIIRQMARTTGPPSLGSALLPAPGK